MAKKEISIVLKAKNEMQIGLAKAGDALKSFGAGVLNVGKWIAGAFLAGGTAIAGFAAKALSAYAVQEGAVASLRGALRAHGEEVDANVSKIEEITAAIQDQTGVSDESLIAAAARLRMLGVTTDAMDESLKATVALKAAGMQEEQAIKAVAQARNGIYTSLTRYIPALQAATSEEQKAVILSDFLSKGYSQQEEKLRSVSGRWQELKGRVGDVWEEFGALIAQNGLLSDALAMTSEKIKAFGSRVKSWGEGGGLINLIANIRLFGAAAEHNFMLASNAIHGAIAVLYGFTAPVRYISDVISEFSSMAIANFKFVADYIVAIAEKAKRPWREFDPPDITPVLDAYKSLGDTITDFEVFKFTEAKEAAATRLSIEEEYAESVSKISAWQLDALSRNEKTRVEVVREAVSEIVDLNKAASAEIIETKRAETDEIASFFKEAKAAQEEAYESAESPAPSGMLDPGPRGNFSGGKSGAGSYQLPFSMSGLSEKQRAEVLKMTGASTQRWGLGDRVDGTKIWEENVRQSGLLVEKFTKQNELAINTKTTMEQIRDHMAAIRQQNEKLLSFE
jgi:hypothetical protein